MKEKKNVAKYKNELSVFEQAQNKFKYKLFYFFHQLIKHQDKSISLQIIVKLIETFQLLAFPFALQFESSWKQNSQFKQISQFFQYFQVLAFLENNDYLFQFSFYLSVVIIMCLFIWIAYFIIVLNKKINQYKQSLSFLRFVLFLCNTIFFIPLFKIIISMIHCIEVNSIKVNYIALSIACNQSIYYLHFVVSILFGMFYSILSFIFLLPLNDTRIKQDNPNAKISLDYDKLLLIIKICLCIVFNFISTENEWVFGIIVFMLSLILLYYYHKRRPHLNYIVRLLNLFSVSIFCWGSLMLLIGIFFKNSFFDGCIPLFFIGIPVILFTLLIQKENQMNILLPHLTKFKQGIEVITQIRKLLILFNLIENNRNAKIILQGYAYQYESQCLLVGCPLKKYIELLGKNQHMPFLFLQHTQILYQNAIDQFPLDNTLRLSYCFFLLEYLNKTKLATQELLNIENNSPNYEQQFVIFRYKTMIEEQKFDLNDSAASIDISSTYNYQQTLTQFKEVIKNISLMYIDFWTYLLNKSQEKDQLIRLSNYGTKIIIEVKKLQLQFDILQKIKPNDSEVLCYYSEFLKEILNKKVQATENQKKVLELQNRKSNININDYFQLDLNTLQKSDEYQYIVLSGEKKNFGYITNISLGICLLFGFTKEELIGKNCNEFLPEILHKEHIQLLQDKVNDIYKEINNVIKDSKYVPIYKTVSSFAKTKARYLIPVLFDVSLIFTEKQGISFIAKRKNEQHPCGFYNQFCYILTDNYLKIQYFTVNSVNILGMKSDFMNIEISRLIKQLNEEILKTVSDNNSIGLNNKMVLQKKIINNKFRNPSLITWKSIDNIQDGKIVLIQRKESQVTTSIDLFKLKNQRQEEFILKVEDVIIGKKQKGYIFRFENYSIKKRMQKEYNGENIMELNSKTENKKVVNKTIPMNITSSISFDELRQYIPQNKNNFALDSQKMSYVQSLDSLMLKNEIKRKAIEKMKINVQIKEKEFNFLNEIENESSDYSQSSIMSNDSININDANISFDASNSSSETQEKMDKCFTQETKNSSNSKVNNTDQNYYKVNMTNIKLSIYSFEKNVFIEENKYPKRSQIEIKLFDENNKEESKQKENINRVEKINVKQGDNKKEGVDKKEIILKQIEFALSKEESQPTIIKLRWVTFCIMLYFFGFGIGWLIMVVNAGKSIKENYVLITNSYKILINSFIVHSQVRELTLLAHANYSTIYGNKTKVTISILKELNSLYFESHFKMLEIMTSKFQLTTDNKLNLYNTTLNITVIKEDYNITQYEMILSAAFMEINTGVFHIVNHVQNYYSTNNYIFLILYNINNNLSQGLERQAKICINESFNVMKKYKTYCYCLIIIGCTVSVETYFIFFYFFNAVVKKKESYLEFFFKIRIEVIISLLQKCEQFAKKLHEVKLNKNEFSIKADDLDIYSNFNQVSDKKEKTEIITKQKSKETWSIKLLISSLIVCVIILISLYFSFYFYCLNSILNYFQIYQSQNDVFIEYEKLFRNFREYVFDDTILIDSNPVNKTFPKYLNTFYENVNQKEKYLISQKENFPTTYTRIYNQLYHKELCQTVQVDTGKCTSSLLFNGVQYGLSTLLSVLIEEIREIKSLKMGRDNGIKINNFFYNMTLYGTDLYFTYFPNTENQEIMARYFRLSPFQLFANKEYANIKLIMDYFIKPSFLILNEKLEMAINYYIREKEVVFYVINSLYLLFVLSLYLLIWKPFEFRLNSVIFKTKNMLSIIPRKVLVSLTNIQTLLSINYISKNSKEMIDN